jgi:hypothetical protein
MPSKQVRKQLQAQYDRRITEAKDSQAAKRRGGVAGVAQESNAAATRQDDINKFLTAYSAKSDAEKADFGKFVKKYSKSFDKSVNQSVKKGNFGTYAQAKTTAAAAKADILAGKADGNEAGLGSKIQKVQGSKGKHEFGFNIPAIVQADIPKKQKEYLAEHADLVVTEKNVDKSINKARNARVALGKALGFKEDKNRKKRPATQFVRKQAKNERQSPDVRGI